MRSEEHSFEETNPAHHRGYNLSPTLEEIKSIELLKSGITVIKYHYTKRKSKECTVRLNSKENKLSWRSLGGGTLS